MDAPDAAELVGLAALVWVAIDTAMSIGELADELDADAAAIEAAISLLASAGWANGVHR